MLRFLAVSMLFAIAGCSASEPEFIIPEGARVISFSGYEWVVSNSEGKKAGPGPNYFSDSEENVWVDEKGRLHLKITFRNEKWHCARVELARHTGYGRYIFYVSTRPDSLDRQVVWGLYTYKNDNEEIDIEFSQWGIENNQEAQYAIQPSHVTGNKARFRMNMEGTYSTHLFDWTRKWIDFASYHGHRKQPVNETEIIARWRYYGDDIPPDSDEKLKMNLWLFRGTPPSDGKEAEVVIDRVEII
ncbi:MAG: glycoside hydrolase family 16 protein [Bacteroidales bacterium]|nr:glycoside hydrolase family 16 protein [Bacteroidales bacterium]